MLSDKEFELWKHISDILTQEIAIVGKLKSVQTMEEENEYCDQLDEHINESLRLLREDKDESSE
ncbi:MAG TPA: hypothetical protein VKK79_09265 [Candidatus Lokiarchaeia archaeon]|nr:hypothetical protein [Candidatus Lokiarchaeia archaeon]